MSQFSFLDMVVVGLTLIALTVGIFQIISDYQELEKIKKKVKYSNKMSDIETLQHH
jgi:uncharacterized membrane protein YjfL (UPF0719 family)